ncbi:unnamed protein product [Ambrosiozyma monospora]|uniref:Unnamed protein product n=1 Tax=Ambrosiozyma monospora TaxID=43982 RepID=A0ACB5TBC8_AMBMO|nr:unnamed protein product [Ambrosiozyma monospora]
MSAKTKAHTNTNSFSSPSTQAKPAASTTANDDLFGSFASTPATNTAKPAPAVQQSKPAEQNGVVDLLSF